MPSGASGPGPVELELLLHVSQLLPYAHRRSTPARRTCCQSPRHRQHAPHVRRQQWAHLRKIGIVDIFQPHVVGQAPDDQVSDRFVCIAEGGALADQELGHVRSKAEPGGCCLLQPITAYPHGRDGAGERGQDGGEGLDCVEDRLLVLLQVAVVRQVAGL